MAKVWVKSKKLWWKGLFIFSSLVSMSKVSFWHFKCPKQFLRPHLWLCFVGRTVRWLWSRWARLRRPSSPWSSSTTTTWERTTTSESPSQSPPSSSLYTKCPSSSCKSQHSLSALISRLPLDKMSTITHFWLHSIVERCSLKMSLLAPPSFIWFVIWEVKVGFGLVGVQRFAMKCQPHLGVK